MAKRPVTPHMLRHLLRYDPETGLLFWKERGDEWFDDTSGGASRIRKSWNSKFAGKEAFTTTNHSGYRMGALFGRKFMAHRVIWAMANLRWPVDQIDHINHDRADNRLRNLREATAKQNGRNQVLRSTNTSGVFGVTHISKNGRWRASITVDGRARPLGSFAKKEDAIQARLLAEEKYGFHGNHGKTK